MPARPARTASRRAVTPYLRDPAVVYGGYAAIVILLLVWAPVPAASDPLIATILIVLGALGLEALRRLAVREFPDHTDRDLGNRVGAWASHASSSASNGGQPAPAPAAQARDDRYTELERLASLRDRGVLTDAEFTSQKATVLAEK